MLSLVRSLAVRRLCLRYDRHNTRHVVTLLPSRFLDQVVLRSPIITPLQPTRSFTPRQRGSSPQDAYHGTNHSKRTSSEDPDQPRQSTSPCSAWSPVERRPSGHLSFLRRFSVFMMTPATAGRGRFFQTLFVRPGLKSWQMPSGLAGGKPKSCR